MARTRFVSCLSLLLLLLANVFFAAPLSHSEDELLPPQFHKAPQGAIVNFRDSFMREKPEEGEWRILSGLWRFDQSAKPGVSANPFSLNGSSPETALIVVGEKWWGDYLFKCAMRTPPAFLEMGVVYAMSAPDTGLFFGFSEAEGLVLKVTSKGVSRTLASKKSWPIPYQWYTLCIAVSNRTAFALLDGNMVFEAELPFLMSGPAGMKAVGVADFGVTVDDCAAQSLPSDIAVVRQEAMRNFRGVFESDLLTARKFPSYFTDDPVMRKWASAEADWVAWPEPVPDENNVLPPPGSYCFAMPIFNDLIISFKAPDQADRPTFDFLAWNAGIGEKPAMHMTVTNTPGLSEFSFIGANGQPLCENITITANQSEFHLKVTSEKMAIRSNSTPWREIDCKVLGRLLDSGLRVVISPYTFNCLKVGSMSINSSSLVDETFYEAPANWLTVFGNWEIGSRWACSPQFTYLSSWDPLSSQLYSKDKYSGKFYADIWLSDKMYSYKWPCYQPMQWMSVSMPEVPGDFSSGYTFAGAWPSKPEMCIISKGKILASLDTKENLDPWALHNAWIKLRIERDEKGTSLSLSVVDKVPNRKVHTISISDKADNRPRCLALWNSLTGMTATRVRITAQKIEKGGNENSLCDSPADPCGLDLSLAPQTPDKTQHYAPCFDFSKGMAGWKVPSNQPALRATPYLKGGKRIGLKLWSPFCASRLAFESPKMSVDARVWHTLSVRYKTDVAMALYLKAGPNQFRVLLGGRGKVNNADWAIPVSSKYVKLSTDSNFTTANVDLWGIFEEYLAREYEPVIDGLRFERLDIMDTFALGVDFRNIPEFFVGSLDFKSSYAPSGGDVTAVDFDLAPNTPKAIQEFHGGISNRQIRISEGKADQLFNDWRPDPYEPRKGAIALSFEKGFQSLTQVGSTNECQLWRQRIDREVYMTVNKTDLMGFFGVKLLPEPISIDEFPAMSLKVRGNTDVYFLKVKSGNWFTIPLKPVGLVNIDKVANYRPLKVKTGPVKVVKGEESWLMFSFSEMPEFKDKPVIEEIWIIGGSNQVIWSGTAISISSVLFYDPESVDSFKARNFKSSYNLDITTVETPRKIRDIRVDKVETFVYDRRAVPQWPTPSKVESLSLDATGLTFVFDAPVSVFDLQVSVGHATLSGTNLKYPDKATPNIILVPIEGIFSDEAGPVDWSVKWKRGGNARALGVGKVELGEARPLRVERIVVIPEDHLVFDDYENGIGEASSRRAPALVTASNPAEGKGALEVACLDRAYCSAYLRERPFDAVRYPYCSFDYRFGGANVSLMFKCEGHFKDVKFTPVNIALNLYKDIYFYIAAGGGMTLGVFGELPNIKTDGSWNSTTFRIMDQLKGEPFNGRYMIDEMALRECSTNQLGVWVAVDNYCLWGTENTYFDVRVKPPTGIDEEKLSYEWRLLGRDGKEVIGPTRSKTPSWRVTPPKGDGYTLGVKVVYYGKTSACEELKSLENFRVK
ncbi:MAG: hypothetical protein Kow00107_04120 [Planctomycetota bacterium]